MRVLITFLLSVISMTQSMANIFPILPDSVNGWVGGNIQRFTDNNNLYDYIDGGAELYISYGYISAISRRYTGPGQQEVTVEIFDMGDPENAFGVFSHTRYEEDYTFGQGSQYVEGVLFFWKKNYYVSIMSPEETDESKKLINDLGEMISDAIEGEGTVPGILDLLPSGGLDKAGILYFHHYIWLNSYYYIADENFLLIDDNADAVLAKYGKPENRSYLLIIQYKDKETASKAYENFLENYFQEGKTTDVLQLEDQSWMSANLSGYNFIAVFNGKSEKAASGLLSDVKLKLQYAGNSKK